MRGIMGEYQIRIKLLSDLCAADGGVYNSSVDIDVCHDEAGFPYIPGKTLKGCLRECAEELNDWGDYIDTVRLFGREGNQSGFVRISNARLEGYQEKKKELSAVLNHPIGHPQNILNQFSYIRTQTSVDPKTQTAEEGSLRTVRVVNKGLEFTADVFLGEETEEREKEDRRQLERCCKALAHMGVSRTRGLGEVRVTLEEKKEPERPGADRAEQEEVLPKTCPPGCIGLEYEITFLEPVIMKSLHGGEANSSDYIEGGKILGLIAQEMKKQGEDAFLKWMDKGTLICSNAYLSEHGIRLSEAPACYYEIKNNSTQYVDKSDLSYSEEEHRKIGAAGKKTQKSESPSQSLVQLSAMKHCYVALASDPLTGKKVLVKRDVALEEHYHHRRPEDKAVGRALANEGGNSHFYQMSAIQAGQKMKGYILCGPCEEQGQAKASGQKGKSSQMEELYQCLKGVKEIRLGYSKNAEYGTAGFSVTGFLNEEEAAEGCEEGIRDFAVKLESPMILYGDHACYTVVPSELEEEICAALGLDRDRNVASVNRYLRYTTEGGYNVTWKHRKPVVEAFDKGSVLCFHLKEPKVIRKRTHLFAGERNTEGYGEYSIQEQSGTNQAASWLGALTDQWPEAEKIGAKQLEHAGSVCGNGENGWINVEHRPFLRELCGKLFEDYLHYEAIRQIQSKRKELTPPEAFRSTVSNMISIWREQEETGNAEAAAAESAAETDAANGEKEDKIDAVKREVIARYEKAVREKEEKLKRAKWILGQCSEAETDALVGRFQREFQIAGYPYRLPSGRGEHAENTAPDSAGSGSKEMPDDLLRKQKKDVRMKYLGLYLIELKYTLRR